MVFVTSRNRVVAGASYVSFAFLFSICPIRATRWWMDGKFGHVCRLDHLHMCLVTDFFHCLSEAEKLSFPDWCRVLWSFLTFQWFFQTPKFPENSWLVDTLIKRSCGAKPSVRPYWMKSNGRELVLAMPLRPPLPGWMVVSNVKDSLEFISKSRLVGI